MNLVRERVWLKEMTRSELQRNGIVIVVIHDEDVHERITKTSQKLQVPITILDSLTDLGERTPHFVFFGKESTDKELQALETLPDKYVTTIGESPDFFRRGGCFRINLDVPPKNEKRMMYHRQTHLDTRVQYKAELFRHITQATDQD